MKHYGRHFGFYSSVRLSSSHKNWKAGQLQWQWFKLLQTKWQRCVQCFEMVGWVLIHGTLWKALWILFTFSVRWSSSHKNWKSEQLQWQWFKLLQTKWQCCIQCCEVAGWVLIHGTPWKALWILFGYQSFIVIMYIHYNFYYYYSIHLHRACMCAWLQLGTEIPCSYNNNVRMHQIYLYQYKHKCMIIILNTVEPPIMDSAWKRTNLSAKDMYIYTIHGIK